MCANIGAALLVLLLTQSGCVFENKKKLLGEAKGEKTRTASGTGKPVLHMLAVATCISRPDRARNHDSVIEVSCTFC